MSKLDIVIQQNSVFRIVVSVVGGPANLTGYTGEMQVREAKEDPDVLAEASLANITVNNLTRQVIVELPSTATALYDWEAEAVYDLYIEGPGGDRWRLCEGLARLSKTVTREE